MTAATEVAARFRSADSAATASDLPRRRTRNTRAGTVWPALDAPLVDKVLQTVKRVHLPPMSGVDCKNGISPRLGKAIVTLNRSAFKWAATAVLVAGSLFAAASASAEVNWSIGIGAPLYYEAPAPVYTAPPPVYYEPPPRVYRPAPPPVYYRPAPVYYGPPPTYYESEYRGGYRHRHHERRDWGAHDD